MGLEWSKPVLDVISAATPVPPAVEGFVSVVTGGERLKQLHRPEPAQPSSALKPTPRLALELTRELLEAIPAGTPLPTAAERIAAVVAGIGLLKRLGDPDAAEDGRLETFLVYSSDVVDIASFLCHVVPALHALNAPLAVLGIALKSRDSETVHAFSLTPQYGTLAAASVKQ